jgi:energy-coupling factor transporter transmembrane protein EcfT
MAIPKPSKKLIQGHIGYFVITAALIVISLLWVIGVTKYFVYPVWTWIAFILLSATFFYFTVYYTYREETSTNLNPNGGPQWYHYLLGALIYAVIMWSICAGARSQRVDNCIPSQTLSPEKNPQKWIDFEEGCPNSPVLLDEPAKEFILSNKKLPYWLMDKSGHTSDPIGWWKYYFGNPKNPYPLTQGVQDTLYNTNFLPGRLINK